MRALLYNNKSSQIVNEASIRNEVITCFFKHNKNYGRIRIKKDLNKKGIIVSEWKISNILKEHGLYAKSGRRKKYKKQVSEETILTKNLLLKKDLKRLNNNDVWTSDISYFQTATGTLYVTSVLDVASRKILSTTISSHQRQTVVHDAIRLASIYNPNKKDIIFHSDRGSQYTAKETQIILKHNNLISSMSRPGKPNDNQYIESFWHTMKTEIGSLKKMTMKQAREVINDYITNYYNDIRMHSGLDYSTPNEIYDNVKN